MNMLIKLVKLANIKYVYNVSEELTMYCEIEKNTLTSNCNEEELVLFRRKH